MIETHQHLMADAIVNIAPKDPEFLNDWFRRVIKAVDMEIFIEPESKYSDDPNNLGLSGYAQLTTSHTSLHCFEQPSGKHIIKADLYSCKCYDPKIYIKFLEEFDPVEITYSVVDRTNQQHIITEQDTIFYNE